MLPLRLHRLRPPSRKRQAGFLRLSMFSARWGGGAWSPRALFASGEQGGWYDPSDFSTMFQDSAGSTPVTAVGQPVGLLLDTRLGLIRGPELFVNGDFSNGSAGVAPTLATLSVVGGSLVVTATTAGFGRATQTIPTTIGMWYEVTGQASRDTATTRARVIASAGGTVLASVTTPGGLTAFRGTFQATAATTDIFLDADTATAGTSSSFDNISVKALPGNHASQATTTKRPLLQQDASGLYYLLFDGVDDNLNTGTVDFTATDKMLMVAGVRKLSDTARAALFKLNAGSGAFLVEAPGIAATAEFAFRSVGTLTSILHTPTIYAAPLTAVVTAQAEISTDTLKLRVNQTEYTSASDQGAGNYGSVTMNIGSDAAAANFFNGRFYGLIVRGALSSAVQVTKAEHWMAQRTGVTL